MNFPLAITLENYFLTPEVWFGLLALPLLLLMYFLRLRRQEKVLSSTMLWGEAIKDLRVNSPFQRIRASLLLLLQVLILLLLGFALMRPFMSLESRDAKLIVILIDNSASMSTADAKYNGDVVTRLEMAKGKALESIRHLNANDLVMVTEFNQHPRTMQSFTNVRASIERAIRDIEPTDLRTDLAGAMSEIQETVNTKRASLPVNETRAPYLKLYSDGAFIQDDLDLDPAILDNFQFIQCGLEVSNNVGITALNVRRSLVSGIKDPLQAFFTIENFSAEPRTFKYKVLLNGEVVQTSPGTTEVALTLAGRPQPGDPTAPPDNGVNDRPWRRDVMLALQPDKSGSLEIKLDIDDNLLADNSAVVDVPKPENTRILVVMAADANLFLQRALEAIRKQRASKSNDDFVITYKTPEAFEAAYGKDAQGAVQPENGPLVHVTDYDVVLFHNYAPKFHVGVSALYFGAIPHLAGYKDLGPVDFPVIVDTNRSHYVTRFISMVDVPVAKAIKYEFPRSAEVLIRAQHGVMSTADDDGRFRTIVVAIDPWDSMWMLKPTFPLFLNAALDYLTGASERAGGQSQRTGDALTLPVVSVNEDIQLLDPTGASHPLTLTTNNPIFYADTHKAGLYKFKAKDGNWNYYGVNLASPEESDNAAQGDIRIKGHASIKALEHSKENREIWPFLLMAMLGILIIEWLVYHRQWSN